MAVVGKTFRPLLLILGLVLACWAGMMIECQILSYQHSIENPTIEQQRREYQSLDAEGKVQFLSEHTVSFIKEMEKPCQKK